MGGKKGAGWLEILGLEEQRGDVFPMLPLCLPPVILRALVNPTAQCKLVLCFPH
jgi:hypothetical protein